MDEILNQIQEALNHKLYLIALQCCLTLPDICSALQSDNGKTDSKKYKKWYKDFCKSSTYLDAKDCYLFRCSMVHQGQTIPSPKPHQHANYDRIFFLYPNPNIVLHNNIINGVLNLDLVTFCNDMIASVNLWNKDMIATNNLNYSKNINKLVTIHQNGISPYIVGVPVIG